VIICHYMRIIIYLMTELRDWVLAALEEQMTSSAIKINIKVIVNFGGQTRGFR
jgi:hypothetical protein